MEKEIRPPNYFHRGNIETVAASWDDAFKDSGPDYVLNLYDVVCMDAGSFRLVFNYLSKFKKVIPPKNKHLVDLYDMWLDSKKGLSKN
jgi:hypothetical protein